MVIIAWSMHDFCVGVFEVHPQADQGRRSWWICRDKRSQRRPQCWPRFSRGRQDRPRSTTWRHWRPWPRQANNQQRRGSRPEFTVEIFRKFSHLLQHSLNTIVLINLLSWVSHLPTLYGSAKGPTETWRIYHVEEECLVSHVTAHYFFATFLSAHEKTRSGHQ